MQFIKQEKGHRYPCLGFRARARPNLEAQWLALESYSPETVVSDFDLHSLLHTFHHKLDQIL